MERTKCLALSLVFLNLFSGAYASCFCFGQTSAGKTYTVFGQHSTEDRLGVQAQVPGLVELSANDLFARILPGLSNSINHLTSLHT